MKKFILFSTLLLVGHNSVPGQGKKYVLLEEFTNTSCEPCASQNPGFESKIVEGSVKKSVHLITYHPNFPSANDPMYVHNKTENTARLNYYACSATPTVYALGNKYKGSAGGVTPQMVTNWANESSPVIVRVNQTGSGATRNVQVIVYTVGAVPAGNYVVRTAVIENPMNYTTAPGSNGEKHFPYVFRKMIPTTNGSAYTPAAIGDSVVYTYTLTMSSAWNAANISTTAFVQNNSTKEVLNTGWSLDPPPLFLTLAPYGSVYRSGSNGSPTAVIINAVNFSGANQTYAFRLKAKMPADWSASFSVNGNTYTDSVSLSFNGKSTNAVSVNVMPGATPFVGVFTLSGWSTADTNTVINQNVYVISGVTDLVVNNSRGIADGKTAGDASKWGSIYTDGLTYASRLSQASTDEPTMAGLIQFDAVKEVRNIYYNIGWTYPSLTDPIVQQLSAFLDSGKCLFVAGQDIGWEIFDPAGGGGTVKAKSFYTNYLNAKWNADGSTASNKLTAFLPDSVFGNIAASSIFDYYGGGNMYPDELSTAGFGKPAFYYTTENPVKVAGVRATNEKWKTVYLGVGPEMLSTVAVRNEIIKTAHDWFYGTMTAGEFDLKMKMLSIGNAYPNPASDKFFIPLEKIDNAAGFRITDVQGRIVFTQSIPPGTETIQLDATGLHNGIYFYNLYNSSGIISNVKKINILH